MNDRKFDDLLKSYSDSPVPALPGSFTQDVLREIRMRKRPEESWLSEISALLFRPRLMAASLSLAILIGVLLPTMAGTSKSTLAAKSLGLEIFSDSGMPSGLLSQTQ